MYCIKEPNAVTKASLHLSDIMDIHRYQNLCASDFKKAGGHRITGLKTTLYRITYQSVVKTTVNSVPLHNSNHTHMAI